MPSNFPGGPDHIRNNVANGTLEQDTHPNLHNQLADATNAVQASLLGGMSVVDKGGQVFNVRAYGPLGTADDTATIQAAINACSAAGGGEVLIPGIYNCNGPLTQPSNVNIRGTGNRKARLVQGLNVNNDLLRITGNDCAVRNLGFDGQQTVRQSNASLIRVTGATSVCIEYCRLDNAKEYAVIASGSREVNISYNRVNLAAIHGILIGDLAGGTSGMTDFTVHGNRIYNCGTPGGTTNGLSGKGVSILSTYDPTQGGVVNENVVRNCLGIGIELFAFLANSGVVQNVGVNDNYLEQLTIGPDVMGVSLGFCNDCTAVGNVIYGTEIGIEDAGGTGNTVTGNAIHNAVYGISVSGGTTNGTHVGNTITGSFIFAIHDNSNPAPNKGNIYSGNRITGAGGSVVSRQVGILINNGYSGEMFTITDNQITACSGSGIYVLQADTGLITQNLCKGNVTNPANSTSDADLYFNLAAGQMQKIQVYQNLYDTFLPTPGASTSDTATLNVKMLGATGNGTTDDSTAIASANAALAAGGGGVLLFPPGTYQCSVNLRPAANVIWRGCGEGQTKLRQPAGTAINLMTINQNGVVIEDLGFDGLQSGKAANASLIRVDGASNVTIQRCGFDNAKEMAILVTNTSGAHVIDNRVTNSATHGIVVGDIGGGTAGTYDFFVTRNNVATSGIAGDSLTGIGIYIAANGQVTQRGMVSNNSVHNCKGDGITVLANPPSGGLISEIVVSANSVVAVPSPGVALNLVHGSNCTITGNMVDNCNVGVQNAGSTNSVIIGNALNNVTNVGIDVFSGTTGCIHSGNVITGPLGFTFGIQDNSSPTPNTSNIYSNNLITGSGGSVVARQMGIQILNGVASQRFSIIGNQVTNCSGSGIYVAGADTGTIAQNICSGNVTNAANVSTDADIYINPGAGQLDKIIVGPNIYTTFIPNQTATDGQVSQTQVVGGLHKLASKTIGGTQTTVAHGLSYTPNKVLIKPRSNQTVWESQAADGTNVYLTASASATVDIYVA